MEIIILLILLFLCFCVIGVVGLCVWALARWMSRPDSVPRVVERPNDDLAAFERQLIRFYREGKVNDEVYEPL